MITLFLVPGIAERIAFKTLANDETFHLFNRKHGDLVKLFKQNLVGGPAIIYDRYQEAGKLEVYMIKYNKTQKLYNLRKYFGSISPEKVRKDDKIKFWSNITHFDFIISKM